MIKEVCVENFTYIPEAIARGAGRIELCDNLAVGGTTVSHGVALKAISFCHSHNIKVMTIVRPREGNFVYNKREIEIMREDITHFKQLGTDGIVIGCLDNKGWIDEEAMLFLSEIYKGLAVTFHMAFDDIKPEYQFDAIRWLACNGVQRILTHGGPRNTPIENNLFRLKEYVIFAGDRLTILPGGGITDQNAHMITSQLNVKEVHGTKIVGELGTR